MNGAQSRVGKKRGRKQLVVASVLAVACTREPVPEVTGQGDSETAAASTTESTTTNSEFESGGTQTGEDKDPQPLPAYCGDGVAGPGEYDCYVEVAMPSLGGSIGAILAADLDGDGTPEAVAQFADQGQLFVPFEVSGGEVILGEARQCGSPSAGPWVRDTNADGREDIVMTFANTSANEAIVHRGQGNLSLGEFLGVDATDEVLTSPPLALDAAQNGGLDLLIQKPPLDSASGWRLWRDNGGVWAPVGEEIVFPGCGTPHQVLVGDFDADNRDDILLWSDASNCDAEPNNYDPDFHRFSVLTHDPDTELVVNRGSFPFGGLPSRGGHLGDFDRDGNVDFLVNALNGPGPLLVAGRGDGTFDPGVVVAVSKYLPADGVVAHLQLDGDAPKELVLLGDDGYWVLDDTLDIATLAPFIADRATIVGMLDLNDDGIGDYVRYRELGGGAGAVPEFVVMLSQP